MSKFSQYETAKHTWETRARARNIVGGCYLTPTFNFIFGYNIF